MDGVLQLIGSKSKLPQWTANQKVRELSCRTPTQGYPCNRGQREFVFWLSGSLLTGNAFCFCPSAINIVFSCYLNCSNPVPFSTFTLHWLCLSMFNPLFRLPCSSPAPYLSLSCHYLSLSLLLSVLFPLFFLALEYKSLWLFVFNPALLLTCPAVCPSHTHSLLNLCTFLFLAVALSKPLTGFN